MKSTFTQILVGIVVLVVGTFVGTVVEKYRSESEGRIRYLDKEVSKRKSILSRPRIPGKNLQVILDGNPIENLSQVTISIFNYSDKDYSQVPVYVELIPSSDKPIQIIGERAVGANDLPEAVASIKNVKSSEVTGGLRYGYEIKNVNRTHDFDFKYAFHVSYLLLGEELPNIKVNTDSKGLRLRDFSYGHLYRDSWVEISLTILIPIFGVAAYVLILFLTLRDARKKKKEKDEKLKENLKASLGDPQIREELGVEPQKVADLAIYFVRFIQKFRWEETPRLLRFLSSDPNPEEIPPVSKDDKSVQQG